MIDDLVQLLIAQNFTDIGNRICAEVIDQTFAVPFVRCDQLSGTDHHNTIDGAGGTETADVDIEVKASSGTQAKSIGKAIKAFIRNYTGTMGTVTCKAVWLEDEYSGFEPSVSAGPGRFTYTLTLKVQYQ